MALETVQNFAFNADAVSGLYITNFDQGKRWFVNEETYILKAVFNTVLTKYFGTSSSAVSLAQVLNISLLIGLVGLLLWKYSTQMNLNKLQMYALLAWSAFFLLNPNIYASFFMIPHIRSFELLLPFFFFWYFKTNNKYSYGNVITTVALAFLSASDMYIFIVLVIPAVLFITWERRSERKFIRGLLIKFVFFALAFFSYHKILEKIEWQPVNHLIMTVNYSDFLSRLVAFPNEILEKNGIVVFNQPVFSIEFLISTLSVAMIVLVIVFAFINRRLLLRDHWIPLLIRLSVASLIIIALANRSGGHYFVGPTILLASLGMMVISYCNDRQIKVVVLLTSFIVLFRIIWFSFSITNCSFGNQHIFSCSPKKSALLKSIDQKQLDFGSVSGKILTDYWSAWELNAYYGRQLATPVGCSKNRLKPFLGNARAEEFEGNFTHVLIDTNANDFESCALDEIFAYYHLENTTTITPSISLFSLKQPLVVNSDLTNFYLLQ